MSPSAPRRWLLISREVGVPGEAHGGAKWALDHLFIDQDGIPTLVDVKRSTNSQIRREVVGQLLDYAANGSVYWSLVSYFVQGQPVLGYAKYPTAHKKASYQFASESNLRAFESDPEKYLPQYGGFCAFGTAEGGKFDGNPQLWQIVDGKLYLVVNEDIQKLWREDIASHIEIADHNWPKIADKPTDELYPEVPPSKLR